ncbi:hypothetical protein ACROYT_G038909 [Oculina patagonica]
MVVATFFAPMHIFVHTFTHPDGVTGTMLCKLLTGGAFAWTGAASSVFTLVTISVERYFAVTYPHGNKGKLTNNKLKVIIPSSWIFALIINIPEFLVLDFNNNIASCILAWPEEWMGKAYSMLVFLVFALLPILLMAALYSKVVYNLWFKRTEDTELSHQQKGVLKVRKRVTLMVVTVSIIFSICWLTDTVIFILSYYSTANSPSDVTYAIAAIMVLFNSAVNPFVYALINQRFRNKIKRMICCTVRSTRIQASSDEQGTESANDNTRPAHTTESFSKV